MENVNAELGRVKCFLLILSLCISIPTYILVTKNVSVRKRSATCSFACPNVVEVLTQKAQSTKRLSYLQLGGLRAAWWDCLR